MFDVYFFENKDLLLSQLRNRVPSIGEDLTIKGRKGKVSSINSITERKIHVQVSIETAIKTKKNIIDDSQKKKKR